MTDRVKKAVFGMLLATVVMTPSIRGSDTLDEVLRRDLNESIRLMRLRSASAQKISSGLKIESLPVSYSVGTRMDHMRRGLRRWAEVGTQAAQALETSPRSLENLFRVYESTSQLQMTTASLLDLLIDHAPKEAATTIDLAISEWTALEESRDHVSTLLTFRLAQADQTIAAREAVLASPAAK